MKTNAFKIEPVTHSICEEEIDRAREFYQEQTSTEADDIIASLPDEEHEPSSQYPMM